MPPTDDSRSRRAPPLRWSVAITTVSQVYVTAVAIGVVPYYLRYMGAEAYGLVAFYALLLTLLQFLDAGLTAGLTREAVRFRAGAINESEFASHFAATQRLFIGLAVVIAVCLACGSSAIAEHWLDARALSSESATQALLLMSASLPMRWVAGMYRGALMGFGRFQWLGVFNAGIATIRFAVAIPWVLVVDSSVQSFFAFQLLVSLLEIGLLLRAVQGQVPQSRGLTGHWLSPLRRTMGFSATLALATIAWLAITQIDRLILSARLTLEQYGHYALTVSLASAIVVLTAPAAQAILPRLTHLVSQGSRAEALHLFRQVTQAVFTLALPSAVAFCLFGEHLLYAWTGDPLVASTFAPALRLYAIGNAVLAIASLPYCLQYAAGDVRAHTAVNVILAVVLLPSMMLAIHLWSVIGAAACWLVAMTFYLVCWAPVAIRRFAPQTSLTWIAGDLLRIGIPGTAALLTWRWVVDLPDGRSAALLYFGSALLLSILVAACAMTGSAARLRICFGSLADRVRRA